MPIRSTGLCLCQCVSVCVSVCCGGGGGGGVVRDMTEKGMSRKKITKDTWITAWPRHQHLIVKFMTGNQIVKAPYFHIWPFGKNLFSVMVHQGCF